MSAPTAPAGSLDPPLTVSPAESAPEFDVITEDGARWVALSGRWNLRALENRVAALEPRLAGLGDAGWDLTRVSALDHAGALLLWRTWRHHLPQRLKSTPGQQALFSQLEIPKRYAGHPRRMFYGPVWLLGTGALSFLDHLAGFVTLLGSVSLNLLVLARYPRRVPWKEISANLYRTGAQALGITALVGFLVGV